MNRGFWLSTEKGNRWVPLDEESSRARGAPSTLFVPGRPTQAAGLNLYNLSVWQSFSTGARRWTPVTVMRRIGDYNPDAAMALWNFLRLGNPGHALEVTFSAGPRKGQPDEEGKALLEELSERAGMEYGGGLDMLINIMLLTLPTQGAIAAEVELPESLKEVVDYVLVDPRLIGFVRNEQKKWAPVVAWLGRAEPINTNQFRYLPLDPYVDDPHGRAPFWPALQIAMFQLEVLNDLKAVAHNQGYPRIDVRVVYEVLYQRAPARLKQAGAEKELRAWMNARLEEIQNAYNSLEPDDSFIHFDGIEQTYIGPGRAGSIDLRTLIDVLDSQVVASLKQLPILLGRNEGATTTHASIQWQIYVAGIEALQRQVKRLVEWMHNVALQIYGRQSKAKITFHKIRTTDREAEARAEFMETKTKAYQVLAGWISNDEAAQTVAGHDAVAPMGLIPTGNELRMPVGVEQRQMGPPDPSGGSELALIPRAPAYQRNAYQRMVEMWRALDQMWKQRAEEEINALRDNGGGG